MNPARRRLRAVGGPSYLCIWDDFRAARGERDDPLAVELGMIAGLVMYGWILGHSAVIHPDPSERTWARTELEWWVPRARHAPETWSPP